MDSERWQRLRELFDAAMDLEARKRPGFIARSCEGDQELQRALESLVEHSDETGSAVDRAVMETIDLKDSIPTSLDLHGRSLGQYRIVEKIGEGGMGEVYRATDTRLGRDVAIKSLPEAFARDPEMLARFKREARVLASLKHPNIATIHDVEETEGVHFLVLELVEGVSLRSRLAEGALPLKMLVRLAAQIAAGLAKAHEAGVVHRDLKPDNLMLTDDGYVKILDFGLAKTAVGPEDRRRGWTDVKTATGRIMGTTSYMSPEQARGEKVDTRTDLFSLGVVLYEMATGRLPFPGQSAAEVVSAILLQEPEHPSLPNPEVPPELERLILACLEKNREKRCQSASQVATVLQRLKRVPTGAASRAPHSALSTPAPTALPSHRQPWLRLVPLAVLVAVGVIALGWWLTSEGPQEVSLPPPIFKPFTTDGGWKGIPALSPDGERVAYAWRGPTDDLDIYVKGLGAGAVPLRLTEDPAEEDAPAWSPDGREIAFIRSGERNAIYILPSTGGPARKLTDLSHSLYNGLSWSPDGRRIAFSEKTDEEQPFRIVALSVESLERTDLTFPPPTIGGDYLPEFSPDGERVAFARRVEVGWGNNDVWVQSSAGGEPEPVTTRRFDHAIRDLSWTPDAEEIIVSVSAGMTFRAPTAGGTMKPVSGLGSGSSGVDIVGQRMVYRQSRLPSSGILRSRGRLSPRNERTPAMLGVSTAINLQPVFSPDGGRIAFASDRSGSTAIWIMRSDGTEPSQVTPDDHAAGTPSWSPDGRQIVFDSRKSGNYDLWLADVEGGLPQQLTIDPAEDGTPSWSRDGTWIYFHSLRSGRSEIWRIPAVGGNAEQITKRGGSFARESWDGKTLVYAKSPELTGLWQVPVGGGDETEIVPGPLPLWWHWDISASGIYYFTRPTATSAFSSFDHGYKGRFTLSYADFSTGEVSEVLVRERQGYAQQVSVSPDELWLVFAEIPPNHSELLLIENFE